MLPPTSLPKFLVLSRRKLPAVTRSLTLRCPAIYIAICFALLSCNPSVAGQDEQLKAIGKTEVSGKILSLKPGQITVAKPDGQKFTAKIQNKSEKALSLEGGKYILPLPASIKVEGRLPAALIEPGMLLRFQAKLNKQGKTEAPVAAFQMAEMAEEELKVENGNSLGDEYTECQVAGRVQKLVEDKLTLLVAKSKVAPKGKLVVEIDPAGNLAIEADSLSRVLQGDQVKTMEVIEFSNGDKVVRKVEIELQAKREKATLSYDDQLEQKHSKLSDEPRDARTLTSEHFVLYTDISDRSAAVLLDKLERMFTLVGKYYTKRPRKPIECYVVSDMNKFPNLPPNAIESISTGAGITMARQMLNAQSGEIVDVEAIVYSCDDHGVVQHEAVHCFCNLTFGSPGPIWYAEGMAEMGQYWKPDELGVNVDPVVIDYLTSAEKKPLDEIVKAGQITGDSWQAYAWRWALCHLLASHPAHSAKFRKLGVEMMIEKDGANFETCYGDVARQLAFEYDQFVRNFGNGYRVDLCAWDFKTKPSKLLGNERVSQEINAAAGWQSTTLEIVKGESYDYIAQGKWKIRKDGEELDGNGDESGNGQLVGAIFTTVAGKYQLSEPIELSAKGTLVAPASGHLYVRCQEDWTELADNEGELKLYFRLTPKKE
jgi:hypothetical protein